MAIDSISIGVAKNTYQSPVTKPISSGVTGTTQNKSNIKSHNLYASYLANISKAGIAFKGYNQDYNPAKKLFWILTGRSSVYEDGYTKDHYVNGGNTGWKKWVNAPAYELLNRAPEQAIQSICTIAKPDNSYPGIPDFVKTPNYGDKWGRKANYIEINPRTVAKHEGNRVSEGLLGAIKLLPAIPPSGNSFANCVVLSQLYPTVWGESYTGDGSSLYTMNLNTGISKNLTSGWLERDGVRMQDEELVKSFNDLAHMRGLKTGFRMLLSEGQMWVNGESFSWYKHENDFIEACCKGIDMGFDAIYFDSAKHIDGYESEHYCGVGNLPNYKQMQYITDQIRKRTGRNDIAFIGEKCDKHPRFEEMGFTAGTDRANPSDRGSVEYESRDQSWNQNYAAGPEVSNDNDPGWYDFNERLKRLDSCLYAYDSPHDKLPTYMQMHDLFPLTPYTNTHDEMLKSISKSSDGSPESHYYNIFDTSDSARWFQNEVNQKFANAIYR